jgi:hypothetical protein
VSVPKFPPLPSDDPMLSGLCELYQSEWMTGSADEFSEIIIFIGHLEKLTINSIKNSLKDIFINYF